MKITKQIVEKHGLKTEEYANIKNEVVLSSSGNMIELWNTNDYESVVNNSE